MSNNVSISLLLSGNTPPDGAQLLPSPENLKQNNATTQIEHSESTGTPIAAPKLERNNIRSLVSQYQTSIKVGDSADNVIVIDDSPPPPIQPSPLPSFRLLLAADGRVDERQLIKSESPSVQELYTPEKKVDLSNQVSKFQTNFEVEVPKKTSILSIMNYDKPLVEEPKNKPIVPKSPQKKKMLPKKPEPKKSEKRKGDKKVSPANKKRKTPEPAARTPKEPVVLPPPELLEVNGEPMEAQDVTEAEAKGPGESKESGDKAAKSKPEEKNITNILEPEKKEVKEAPIIALNIPLIDSKAPKAGQSEVVVNVLKLAEEKYGWSTLHPNAKSAIEVMDDLLDDDENNDDDDDDVEIVEPVEPNRRKNEENLTEEQLIRQHQTKMNRKVGKYDYEDPFIDDDELKWEEGISSTKEGFFVYWGPLVEERNTKKIVSKKR